MRWVKVRGVEWDAANRRHFRERHRCSESQANDIIWSRCHPARGVDLKVRRGTPPRRIVFGRTCGGRYMRIVVEPKAKGVLRPITAWPMTEREIRVYEAWRATVKR